MPFLLKYRYTIRPIHLRKDLNEVADLVDACLPIIWTRRPRLFAKHSSPGQRGQLLLSGCHVTRDIPVPFHGYVWVENGKIIGNITLIYLRKRKRISILLPMLRRFAISRRGIARQMTERAIQHVREHGGKSIILQSVKTTGCHSFIRIFGFYEITRRTNWGFDHRPRTRLKS